MVCLRSVVDFGTVVTEQNTESLGLGEALSVFFQVTVLVPYIYIYILLKYFFFTSDIIKFDLNLIIC